MHPSGSIGIITGIFFIVQPLCQLRGDLCSGKSNWFFGALGIVATGHRITAGSRFRTALQPIVIIGKIGIVIALRLVIERNRIHVMRLRTLFRIDPPDIKAIADPCHIGVALRPVGDPAGTVLAVNVAGIIASHKAGSELCPCHQSRKATVADALHIRMPHIGPIPHMAEGCPICTPRNGGNTVEILIRKTNIGVGTVGDIAHYRAALNTEIPNIGIHRIHKEACARSAQIIDQQVGKRMQMPVKGPAEGHLITADHAEIHVLHVNIGGKMKLHPFPGMGLAPSRPFLQIFKIVDRPFGYGEVFPVNVV